MAERLRFRRVSSSKETIIQTPKKGHTTAMTGMEHDILAREADCSIVMVEEILRPSIANLFSWTLTSMMFLILFEGRRINNIAYIARLIKTIYSFLLAVICMRFTRSSEMDL